MEAENNLLPLLKCLCQNIHRVPCTHLVKSHLQLPVLQMLESVFSPVWYSLNGSCLFGIIPVTFFFYIIGMQDKCCKELSLLFVGGI